MPEIYPLEDIKKALKDIDLLPPIEEGFLAYSRGKSVVPPVGELLFENPPGEVHIKYGYIKEDEYYVIKIASGFYENPRWNLPSSNGLMLLFLQRTGELAAILLDEGFLTDIRTAVAGAVVAKVLAPRVVRRIGILGTGAQGHLQLEYLKGVVDCQDVMVWGRNPEKREAYRKDMENRGFAVTPVDTPEQVAEACNLIITATPSRTPLIPADVVQKGTHITAVGSDTPDKIELDPRILEKADIVVADSIPQCRIRGEIHHALKAGLIQESKIRELGQVLENRELGRTSDDEITVGDLTGVAVQDIQIAKVVYKALKT
ncbi:MAG: ornithine cyclodeaminase family protein [Candidatus Aminicenantales bacterium]